VLFRSRIFNGLSLRWKGSNTFERDQNVEQNLDALAGIKAYCDSKKISCFFFWTSQRDVLLGVSPDPFVTERRKLFDRISAGSIVDMTPVMSSHQRVSSLYVDDWHYSREGHQVVGKYLADFVKARRSNLP